MQQREEKARIRAFISFALGDFTFFVLGDFAFFALVFLHAPVLLLAFALAIA
jgi:hypothetical protein